MIPSSVPTMSGGAVSSRSLALAGMKGSKVEAAVRVERVARG